MSNKLAVPSKRSPILAICLLLPCCLVLAGCASTQQSRIGPESASLISNGMTPEQVKVVLGEPRSTLVDNAGNLTWEYRKNGSQGKAVKTVADIGSFGLTANTDAEFQDILTVHFSTNAVAKVTYQENVHTLSRLGR